MGMMNKPAAWRGVRPHLWVAAILVALTGCSLPERAPTFEGELDLSKWQPEQSHGIELRGEWDFFWGDSRSPEALAEAELQERFPVPGFWEEHPKLEPRDGETWGHYGQAAYRLGLRLPENHSTLDLSISLMGTNSAYELWVVDSTGLGTKLMANGRLGGPNWESVPQWKPQQVELPVFMEPDIELILIVDNDHHARGGLWAAPVLHASSTARQDFLLQRLGQAASFGIFIMMGLYHLILFLRRRDDRASLWFGILSLLTGVYQFTTSHFLAFYLDAPSLTGFHANLGLWLCGVMLMNAASVEFVGSLLPMRWLKALRPWMWGFTGISVLFLALTSLPMLSLVGPYLTSVSALVSVVILGQRMMKGLLAKEESALPLFVGFCGMALSVVNDVLNVEGYLQTGTMVPFGLLFFTVSQSWLLARRFAVAYETAEHLSTSLQDEVNARTDELARETERAHALRAKAEDQAERLERAHIQMSTQARLASLGHLISGVCHEIGNPLSFMWGGIDIIEDALPERANKSEKPKPGTVEQGALLVQDGAERIQAALDNLRGYLDQGSAPLVTCDLVAELRQTVRLISPALEKAEIEVVDALNELPPLEGRRGELKQVFLNLLINSLQAMPEGGRLDLESEVDGANLRLRISDSGPGIPEDVRASIFDPFFTTKDPGEGTGLGLSISHNVIQGHGGNLHYDASREGASFVISLPLASD